MKDLEEFEVVGAGDFDGGGEEAREFDEEPLFTGAFDFEEFAFEAVDGTVTHQSNCRSVHIGCDFFRRIVSRRFEEGDG